MSRQEMKREHGTRAYSRCRRLRTLVGFCLATSVCVTFIVSLAGCAEDASEKTLPRHVVLLSLDTARADHFGFMGSGTVKTPHVDALAKESIVFTDYMTVVPTTLASHTSLFSGKYPHNHGTPRNGYMVNLANEMLPEILKSAGFHTAGFAAAFALHSRFDFAQGFDHYDEDFNILGGSEGVHQSQRRAADVTDAVIAYLDGHGVPDRLFLFVHYFDPHWPYTAPPPFDTAYDPAGRSGLMSVDDIKKRRRSKPSLADRHARRQELQYAAEISYMDHHIGRLLSDLRGRGILEETLVVITSDHGENLWDHPANFDHGFNVYQTTMHAVCLIRLPGAELGGTRASQLVTSIDILPTLLDLLGLAVPEGVDGEVIDLLGADEPQPLRARFGQATKPWERAETDPLWINMLKSRCVRQGCYKFIQTPYKGTEELYDVSSDQGEVVDLLEGGSQEIDLVAARLRGALEAWAASADPLPSEFERAQTKDTIERLRSLGYTK